MDLVFSTESLVQSKRYSAWRDAICDVYVHVDVQAKDEANYEGFIREAQFGSVALTDILLSPQHISRRRSHLAKLDKDCYYVQFIQTGKIDVLQATSEVATNAGIGALFCASEPYDLEGHGKIRSYYLELPRQAFAARFAKDRVPLVATMSTGRGLGRIAVEFCAALATQASALDEAARAKLGDELMDVLALAFDSAQGDEPLSGEVVRKARVRSVKAWIEQHLDDPGLSPEAIAKGNGISVRYLHALFKPDGMSLSAWVWNRRLERSYDMLLKQGRDAVSLTEIAYRVGFNSSSHFSTVFRRKFGLRPSDVKRGRLG
jgi:AraC-like DNA-binding protein